jgi:hypothetical protein
MTETILLGDDGTSEEHGGAFYAVGKVCLGRKRVVRLFGWTSGEREETA